MFALQMLLAVFLPGLCFFSIGRTGAALVCLLLQLTIVGWLPASIWATYAVAQFQRDRRIWRALFED